MGVLDAIARLFGVTKSDEETSRMSGPASAVSANGPAHAPSTRTASGSGRPSIRRPEPVAIDLYTDEEDEDMIGQPIDEGGGSNGTESGEVIEPKGTSALGPAPKNRQELLNELRKNYTEVLGLVRKVDGHLDEQSHRSERLLELAESSARNMESLPELVEQNRRVADALADLIELTRDARTRQDAAADRMTKTAVQQLESAQRQTAALQTMQAAMHRAGEADEKMAESIAGFNDTLGEMSSSTRDLGDTIASMRETDAEREAELARLVANSQKWLVAAVVACGLLAVGALFAVLNNVI